MKSEWREVSFSDCADLGRETTIPKSDETTIPYIGLEHIEGGALCLSGHGWANEVTSQKLKFKTGDILFGKLRPYFRKVARPKFDGVCSTDIWVLRAKKDVDQNFLFYVVAHPEFSESATQNSGGTRMPRADWNHTANRKLNLPPLPEQKAITRILGSLDDKIELNRRMNATLEHMAQTLFRAWFVDFEPVKAKAAGLQPVGMDAETAALFPAEWESSTRLIPKGWEVKQISEIAEINSWTLGKNDNFSSIKYIEISEVARGNISNICEYSMKEAPSRARRRLRNGDTVLSTVRPDRGAYFLSLNPAKDLIASTGFAVITPTSVPWSIVHAALTQNEVFDYLGNLADGGAYPAVRPDVIGKWNVVLCANALLEKFHEIAAPLYKKMDDNRQQSQTLAQLRDALLPRLVSGALRVPDAMCEVEAVL